MGGWRLLDVAMTHCGAAACQPDAPAMFRLQPSLPAATSCSPTACLCLLWDPARPCAVFLTRLPAIPLCQQNSKVAMDVGKEVPFNRKVTSATELLQLARTGSTGTYLLPTAGQLNDMASASAALLPAPVAVLPCIAAACHALHYPLLLLQSPVADIFATLLSGAVL